MNMKRQNGFHTASIVATLVAILIWGAGPVVAQPPAPVPTSPAEGGMIVVPTFSWQAASGAAYYEVEVGPQSNPLTVYWSDTTYNLTLMPISADKFTNEPLYWRVRAYDSSNVAGTWSNKVNFTKYIPGPVLSSPADGSSIIEPVLEWQAAQSAAYYKVELSTSPTFYTLDHTYTTYNTRITPVGTIAHETPWYWRVSGMDAADHVGTPSTGWTFDKYIPAPTLVSPANGSSIVEPALAWQAVDGAAYYKVELSVSPTFVPVDHTYTTYNTCITPQDAFEHGTYYWRVSGVDADDNEGTASTPWTFVKQIPAPVLDSPADSSTVVTPTLAWQAVQGAAYYQVEVSTSPIFVPVDHTYTTYNTSLTPQDALALNLYYWRVSGVDADGAVGTASSSRSFTLNAPPSPPATAPQLLAPADGETITTDPTFRWTRMDGADHYRLIVSTDPAFSSTYDAPSTDYSVYTPYDAAGMSTYPNDTYYWKVEARTSGGTVIGTSSARTFTKQMPLPLTAPADGATLTQDPTFQWSRVVGAHHYRLFVSTDPAFGSTYDSVITDYTTYTPYDAAGMSTYVNDTYYWKVEARKSSGTVIATSSTRTFTKQMPVSLIAPTNGAKLTEDPTFQWSQFVGADHYRLFVSTDPAFGSTYESVITDYTIYTPYDTAGRAAYDDDTYYWKVEARKSSGTVIATSSVWNFTKGSAGYQLYLPQVCRAY
jgi:hypothetical protein